VAEDLLFTPDKNSIEKEASPRRKKSKTLEYTKYRAIILSVIPAVNNPPRLQKGVG
jgi:hypothetical protein